MSVQPISSPGNLPDLPANYVAVRDELVASIKAAQVQALTQANFLRNVSYWLVGRALLDLQPDSHGAGYGDKVLIQMSRDLSTAFPGTKGYSPSNLKYMRMLAGAVAAEEIGQQLLTDLAGRPVMRLSWGHIQKLLDKVRNDEGRFSWYASQSVDNGWSRAVLEHEIKADAYERAGRALTNVAVTQPDHASELVQQMGKDPLLFGFLNLAESFRERELEAALVGKLADLMTELGRGFLWAGRQQRLVLTDPDTGEEKEFLLDLLFYHKPTRRWFVIDLKVTEFEYSHAMQVGLYTRIIDQQLRDEYDAPTVGVVLCPSRHSELARMALSALSTPTFITTYTLGPQEIQRSALPAEVQDSLPSDAAFAELVQTVLAQETDQDPAPGVE